MWTYDNEFSFLFLILNKIFKNSTPGKVAYIWHIERVQIDASKFERTIIYQFFLSTFSLPPSSSSWLKVHISFSLQGQIISKSPLPKGVCQPLKIEGGRVSVSFFSLHSGILSGEIFYLMFESIYNHILWRFSYWNLLVVVFANFTKIYRHFVGFWFWPYTRNERVRTKHWTT